jgi:hypothetical protein
MSLFIPHYLKQKFAQIICENTMQSGLFGSKMLYAEQSYIVRQVA